MVRMIHSGDLHLDSPFIGLKHFPDVLWEQVYASTFQSLTHIVDQGLAHQVDVVLLTGDIYDGADRSVQAQAKFVKEMERLAEAEIPVMLIHGNHDHLAGDWISLSLPDNVYTFGPEVETYHIETKAGEKLAFTGFSYGQRIVNERMISSYPQKETQVDYQVGLIHGNLEGITTNHSNYAPFSLPELQSKKYDYWALGHIHKRESLQKEPPIVYSGNIQGRNKKETGEKGCYLVELKKEHSQLTFIPTAPIIWTEEAIDCSEATDLDQIFKLIKQTIMELSITHQNILVHLMLKNVGLMGKQERQLLQNGSFLESLQELPEKDKLFVWPYELTVENSKKRSNFGVAYYQEEWGKMLSELEQGDELVQLAAPLFEHINAIQFLEVLNEEERQELVARATAIVQQELAEEEGEEVED